MFLFLEINITRDIKYVFLQSFMCFCRKNHKKCLIQAIEVLRKYFTDVIFTYLKNKIVTYLMRLYL